MAESVNLNIRIDRELKENAEAFFSAIGLNMTTAITLFMRQSLREQRIPFELKLVPFALSGEAYLESLYEAKKQAEEGKVVSFDSVEELMEFSKERRREGSVH